MYANLLSDVIEHNERTVSACQGRSLCHMWRTETRGMLSLCSCSALHENTWRSGRSIVPIVLFDKAWTTTVSKSHPSKGTFQGHGTDKDWHQTIRIKPCWEVTDSEWAELPSLSVVGVNQNKMSLWRRPNCSEDLDLISEQLGVCQASQLISSIQPWAWRVLLVWWTAHFEASPLKFKRRQREGRKNEEVAGMKATLLFVWPSSSLLSEAQRCIFVQQESLNGMEDMTKDGGDKGGGSRTSMLSLPSS